MHDQPSSTSSDTHYRAAAGDLDLVTLACSEVIKTKALWESCILSMSVVILVLTWRNG